MHLRLIATIAVTMGCAGCFKASPPPAESPPPTSSLSEGIFPHKSNWRDPAQHGLYVKDALGLDATTCLGCHKEVESVSGGAPTCRSCHHSFPHSEPGVTLENHGAFVVANGKTACATQCHGTDLKGGLSGKACTECHSSYPHAPAWSTPAVHGPNANGNLKNNCILCHGVDLTGGASKVSCYTCHKDIYPHPQGWSAPDQHGKWVMTNGTGKCATQCHGIQLEGGLSGMSCGGEKGCHAIWPHPKTGWMAQHGSQARTMGFNACIGCHKVTPPGGQTGVSCTQCHATLPAHAETNWKTTGHGKLVMEQPSTLSASNGCPLCHGAKLDGGKESLLPGLKKVKGCMDCHTSYPQLHKPAAGAPAWNSFNGHGKWVMSQLDVSKGNVSGQMNDLIAACKLCHGDDLKGGNSGKGCYVSGCHLSFPHPPAAPGFSPWASKHGAFANAETPKAASCATANCHGVDLAGLPAGENDVSKKLVKGCADCHLQMPHKPLGQWDHGKSVYIADTTQLDVTKCASCHGEAWSGKGDAKSCYGCHATYPLPHRSESGALNPAWNLALGHGDFVMASFNTGSVKNTAAAPCKICHGSDLTGGASGMTCYKCHNSFPHAAAPVAVGGITYSFTDAVWNGFEKGHGQYLVARATLKNVSIAQQIQGECKSCHGSDLKGGNSQKSCYACHTTYPHPSDWVKAYDAADPKMPGGRHGYIAVRNGLSGCLTGCHGTDGSGGNSGKACATCHDYPHPANWKAGDNAPEYPPHALAVISLHDHPDKNDDTFNGAGFVECAKCHGEALGFNGDHYPLTPAEQTISLSTNLTVPRCTQCHNYPHQSAIYKLANDPALVPHPWNEGHWVTLQGWQADEKIMDATAPGFSQQTCGSTSGGAGCHNTGPWPTGKLKIDLDGSGFMGCNYCHMKP